MKPKSLSQDTVRAGARTCPSEEAVLPTPSSAPEVLHAPLSSPLPVMSYLSVDLACPCLLPSPPSPGHLSPHSCTVPSTLPSTCAPRHRPSLPGHAEPWSLPSWSLQSPGGVECSLCEPRRNTNV
ncbi:hypothetical protein HJG60_011920 [Phyllostomus discolor]|uniref:Uncharacterized protein n=1 Tax=Phyllostomus discolor TaxID=89673 RepID=A0A833ZPM8_9CHIR|nr:hypothetical protein HJG60_011920 [Phyllostomus discolor]